MSIAKQFPMPEQSETFWLFSNLYKEILFQTKAQFLNKVITTAG